MKISGKFILKVAGTLTIISLVVAALLGLVNSITADKIAAIDAENTKIAMSAVAPEGSEFGDKLDITDDMTAAAAAQGGKLVWVASDYLLDDLYNSYSSGANMDLAMNSLSWMIGQADSVSIRSKSLNSTYLTISSSSAAWLKVCMIGIVPLAFLLLGIDEVIRRRKMV